MFSMKKVSLILTLLASQASAILDLVFVLDTTASFVVELAIVQSNIATIMNNVLVSVDADTQFGVVTFEDYGGVLPFAVDNDVPYQLIADLQTNTMNITTLVAGLVVGLGNDMMESGLTAISQLISGAGQSFGQNQSIPEGKNLQFRSDAQKIIVVFTDSAFNDPTETPGYPGPTFDFVTAQLTNSSITPPFRFVGLSPDDAATADLKKLASATGTITPDEIVCFGTAGMGATNITANSTLVCDNIPRTATDIVDAYTNMITAAYALDKPAAFVPLTCGGIYASVCIISGAIAAVLSCFT